MSVQYDGGRFRTRVRPFGMINHLVLCEHSGRRDHDAAEPPTVVLHEELGRTERICPCWLKA